MKRIFITLSMVTMAFCALYAQTVDDVRELMEKGDYATAYQYADSLIQANPADAEANFLFGSLAFAMNEGQNGVEPLATAAKKGVMDAYPMLVDYYLGNYDVDKARTVIKDWRAALSKAKLDQPSQLEGIDDRLLRMTNQLTRVESIPVFARYEISRKEFDDALASINGYGVPQGAVYIGGAPFYINNANREFFWTEPDSTGVNRLFMAGILDDGTQDEAIELTKYVGDGDIIAPYLMDDGETLYFAAKKSDGIGGYDIYMTRRNDKGGFYEPSNVGMPYNSSRDDLMFVMDEMNNIGWWISNRSTNPDSLSVFVFVPNETRMNLPTDTENLLEYAKLDDIAMTLPKGFSVGNAKARVPVPPVRRGGRRPVEPFELSLDDGRIITDLSQFKNQDAATAMREVIDQRNELSANLKQLEQLRLAYGKGDHSLKGEIRALENETTQQQSQLKALTNRVIRLETSPR